MFFIDLTQGDWFKKPSDWLSAITPCTRVEKKENFYQTKKHIQEQRAGSMCRCLTAQVKFLVNVFLWWSFMYFWRGEKFFKIIFSTALSNFSHPVNLIKILFYDFWRSVIIGLDCVVVYWWFLFFFLPEPADNGIIDTRTRSPDKNFKVFNHARLAFHDP